jgi:hypothetical protein
MFTRDFHPTGFLRSVSGTEPFAEYCRRRGIVGDSTGGGTAPSDVRGWETAFAQLPLPQQAEMELELAKVNELCSREGVAHLIEAADGIALPPDHIPGGAPLALWFFLNHHDLFQEVFFRHEIAEVHAWRAAKTVAGIPLTDLPSKASALGTTLQEFFRGYAGSTRFCVVDARKLHDSVCFAARVADRIQLIEGFTEQGQPAIQRVRPALTVLFAYSAADGSVLLKSHLRAQDRLGELLQGFGRAVLGQPVERLGTAFDLDKLKHPIPLLPDREDMESARVKAITLRYPDRYGRRQLKLETFRNDDATAIAQMLRAHVGEGESDLTVSYAEVQVRIRTENRSKDHIIRLWPDRCNLSQNALGLRFRSCLTRWGLTHA